MGSRKKKRQKYHTMKKRCSFGSFFLVVLVGSMLYIWWVFDNHVLVVGLKDVVLVGFVVLLVVCFSRMWWF